MQHRPRLYHYVIAIWVFAAGVPATLAQSFLTNGLVAYYSFTGTADDESGNTNNGVIFGASFSDDRFGEMGKAIAFNGIDQYVQASHQDYLNFPSGDFTISFWAVLNDPAKTQYFIGKDMGQGNTDKWILHYGPDIGSTTPLGPSFLIGAAPAHWVLYAPAVAQPEAGTWHRYLFRKSGTNFNINFDAYGISGGSGPLSLPPTNTAPLTIGQSEMTGFLDGKIDEVRIYNRALSWDEVASLYHYESQPQVAIVRAVKPSFSKLIVGKKYILETSTDMITWTSQGKAFTATSPTMEYPQYWDVENWGQLYFRLWCLPY